MLLERASAEIDEQRRGRTESEKRLDDSSERIIRLEEQLNTRIEGKRSDEQQIAQNRVEFAEKVQQYQTLLEQAKAEAERRISEYKNNLEQMQAKAESEMRARTEAEQKLKLTGDQLTGLRQKLKAAAEKKLQHDAQAKMKTGTCECCGKNNIELGELVKIDSGQLFCRNCLSALKGSSIA